MNYGKPWSKDKTCAASLVAGLLFSASPAAAAGFAGNGCDTVPTELGSAWFRGDHEIRVCIDVAPGFGVGRADIADAFTWASGKWVEYIAAKRINGDRRYDLTGSIDFEHHPLATRFSLQPACDGHEDLRLEAGTTSADSADALTRLNKPIAFALPTASDMRAEWTKGLIWLAPAATLIAADATYHGHPYWAHAPNLRMTLLHELGHVLGVPHVRGTIMEENLEGILRYPAIPLSATRAKVDRDYSKIDRNIELVLCESCALTYQKEKTSYNDVLEMDAWQSLLGRPVTEDYQIAVTTLGDPSFGQDLNVTFTDDTGSATFRITQQFALALKMGDLDVFKRAFYAFDSFGASNFVVATALRTDAVSWLGEMTTSAGTKRQVIVGRNMGSETFMLSLLDGQVTPYWFFVGKSAF